MSKKKKQQKKGRKEARPRKYGGKMWGVVLVGLAVAGFAAIVWWPQGDRFSGSGAGSAGVVQGKLLYEKFCLSCHGKEGGGQVLGSPMGGRDGAGQYIAPALNGYGHMWHHPPKMLFQIVKSGSPASDSPMKGWGGKMSDPEIRGVLDYLMSLWPEQIRGRYRASHGV